MISKYYLTGEIKKMNSKEPVIEISNLKKKYRLGSIGGRTLREDIQSWLAKRRGKKDPNSLVGMDGVTGDCFYALNGIDLTVYKGDALGIVGSNGAGKSTLLKILSRITSPSEGQVKIKGRIASMLEVGTGFHGELTGRENIYLNGAILGMKRQEIDEKINDIIEFSECGKFIDTPVKRYSSGMYVKLAFSVAAHLDSEILIMDEVLAVGDMKFQKKCLDKMNEISRQEGRTILYVSHNMSTITRLCNRCIVIDKGGLIFDGDTAEAVRLYLDNVPDDVAGMDYSDVLRPSWLHRDDVRIKKAIYHKDNTIFTYGESMNIQMEWENNADIVDLCLRVEFTNSAQTPCATSCVYDFYSGKKGDVVTREFDLDISGLMPGKYKTTYTFFYRDQNRESIDVECVKGLSLQINESKEQPLKWVNKNWGDIALPMITVREVEC